VHDGLVKRSSMIDPSLGPHGRGPHFFLRIRPFSFFSMVGWRCLFRDERPIGPDGLRRGSRSINQSSGHHRIDTWSPLAAPQGFRFRFILLVDRAWRNGWRCAGPIRPSYQPTRAHIPYKPECRGHKSIFLFSFPTMDSSLEKGGCATRQQTGIIFFGRGITLLSSRPYQKGARSQFFAFQESVQGRLSKTLVCQRAEKAHCMDLEEERGADFAGSRTLRDENMSGRPWGACLPFGPMIIHCESP
jgi:hypothetical protein